MFRELLEFQMPEEFPPHHPAGTPDHQGFPVSLTA